LKSMLLSSLPAGVVAELTAYALTKVYEAMVLLYELGEAVGRG
jgi:hypothetical protein